MSRVPLDMFLTDPMADVFPQIKEFKQIMGVALKQAIIFQDL